MPPSAADFTFTTGSNYTTAQAADFHNAAFKFYLVDFTMSVIRFETIMGCVLGYMPHLSLHMHTTDGEFVGLARTAVRGRRAWCGGLAVVPAWRGKGVGGLLTRRYLELLCEDSNIRVLQLECINVNMGALRLYRSVGFKTDFALRDYVIRDVEPESATVGAGLSIRSTEQVDMKLPWLQYRTRYSWQREMSSILALDVMQLEVRDSSGEKTLLAILAESRADCVRILAFAHKEGAETGLLKTVICRAAIAMGRKEARIVLEPEHSDMIPLLDQVAVRDEELEEQHMVYEFSRSE